ncbi:hypothetical protein LEMLEM_LOCUS15060 [Lemmus lemmus]
MKRDSPFHLHTDIFMEVQVCNFQERHWCHLLSEYKERGSVGTATARAQDILSPSW